MVMYYFFALEGRDMPRETYDNQYHRHPLHVILMIKWQRMIHVQYEWRLFHVTRNMDVAAVFVHEHRDETIMTASTSSMIGTLYQQSHTLSFPLQTRDQEMCLLTTTVSMRFLSQNKQFTGPLSVLSYENSCSVHRLCGLVVRIPAYRSRGPGFYSQQYRNTKKVVGLKRGPLSLVSTIEELLETKSSGSGLENRDYGRRDSSRWQRCTLYPQQLTLTSSTSGGRSVGIVRSRTQAMEFTLVLV
jgi:hypothetical protein